MEAFAGYDVGRVQSGTDFEANAKSAPRLDAAIRVEIIENANEISGTTVAKNQHENHQCHL